MLGDLVLSTLPTELQSLQAMKWRADSMVRAYLQTELRQMVEPCMCLLAGNVL